MIYREYLVMRKALLWLVGGAFALCVIAFGLTIIQGGHESTNGTLTELMQPISYAAVLFAGIFGVALGNASREPARVFWTFPESRVRSALSIVAVDLAGVAVAFIGLFVVFIGSVYLFGALGAWDVRVKWELDWWIFAKTLGFCFASYGWSALFGIVLRRIAYGGVISLLAMMLLPAFANAKSAIGEVVRKLCVADPWVIANLGSHARADDLLAISLSWVTPQSATLVLCAITIATCAAATAIWSRAEIIAA